MSDAADNPKHCPICTLDLPVTEFGICRARKDGHNLYCKSCIREKVKQGRRALKEYKSARKRYLDRQVFIAESLDQNAAMPIWKRSPVEKVKEAIRKGASTQKEIAQETKLGKDEIGDALANLLLWTHEIKTKIVEGTRLYFINKAEEQSLNYTDSPSLADYLLKRGPGVVRDRKVRRVA